MADLVEEKAHARLSPSASKRWMTCPGSVRLIEEHNIAYKPSKYAAEGTVAHEVHELCLVHKRKASYYLGRTIEADGMKFTVNTNMVEAVQLSLDYIDERVAMAETSGIRVEILVEVRCSLKSLGVVGLDGGTSDVILMFWEGDTLLEVEVFDYKHGQGVAVEAENNTQALSYALGTVLLPQLNGQGIPNGVTITISQPRAHHADGRIRSWEVNKNYILNWCDDELLPKAKETHNPNAKLVASEDGCRFCDVRGNCPKLTEKMQEVVMLDFADDSEPTMPDINSMTSEQKMFVINYGSMLKSFILAVDEQVKSEIDSGSKDYQGMLKLVRKTTRRKFTEEALDELVSPLLDHLERDDLFEEKTRSMTEIERRLKKSIGTKAAKEIMSDITINPEGAIVVAPESDKRKAVEPTLISDFADLN